MIDFLNFDPEQITSENETQILNEITLITNHLLNDRWVEYIPKDCMNFYNECSRNLESSLIRMNVSFKFIENDNFEDDFPTFEGWRNAVLRDIKPLLILEKLVMEII